MTITLTLTDDQALEIMAQVGTMLKKNAQPRKGLSDSDTVFHYVDNMDIGKVFRTTVLADDLGIPTEMVSKILTTRLRKVGLVKMLQRGTWERVNGGNNV